ncbi:hypothetical protein Tco_0422261 [Tanacetum coccineum]
MSHTSSNNEFSKESFRKQTTLLEKRMDESIPWDQKCKSSKELFKIKKSVDTIFDGVERCKQTIAKRTYFGNIDLFIQNTIEGKFCLQIRRINAHSQISTGNSKNTVLNEIDRLSREYYYADHMNAILGVYTDMDEVTNLQCDYLETLEKCKHLEKELSKSRTMSKSFEALQKHTINLELDLQQCKEKIKNDKSFKENQSKEFLKEREQYFEIQDLKAQLQDKEIAISFSCTDLYSITLQDSTSPNPIFLMAKATSSQAWLWHRHEALSGWRQITSVLTPFHNVRTTVLEQDILSPDPQSQENVHQVAEIVTTSNELELLYSPMFSELLM